jgi:hypothetical protein
LGAELVDGRVRQDDHVVTWALKIVVHEILGSLAACGEKPPVAALLDVERGVFADLRPGCEQRLIAPSELTPRACTASWKLLTSAAARGGEAKTGCGDRHCEGRRCENPPQCAEMLAAIKRRRRQSAALACGSPP